MGSKFALFKSINVKNEAKYFFTDVFYFVYLNSNSVLSNIVCIEKLYRIYGAGIHKIRFNLKQEHNIEIPYLIIENILLKSKYQFN